MNNRVNSCLKLVITVQFQAGSERKADHQLIVQFERNFLSCWTFDGPIVVRKRLEALRKLHI
jgi:hypothetical protein